MTSKELLYVKTVAEERSISKAAKKLYMAQPSLSQSIQKLEETLGTQLFHRTPSGLTLTYAGERYCQTASQILKMYENLEQEISDINDLKTGRIQLGITNHLGALVLPVVLPSFRLRCPNVEIEIMEENTAVLEQALLAGALDFAIMHAPKETLQPQLVYELLEDDPFLLAMSPRSPLLDQTVRIRDYPYPVLDLKFLKNEPLILLRKEQRIRQVADAALKKAGIAQPDVILTLKNFETACMLASQGLGTAFVPSQYTQLISGRYPTAFCSIHNSYDAVWNMCIASSKGSFLTRADRLFIQEIKTAFPVSAVQSL